MNSQNLQVYCYSQCKRLCIHSDCNITYLRGTRCTIRTSNSIQCQTTHLTISPPLVLRAKSHLITSTHITWNLKICCYSQDEKLYLKCDCPFTHLPEIDESVKAWHHTTIKSTVEISLTVAVSVQTFIKAQKSPKYQLGTIIKSINITIFNSAAKPTPDNNPSQNKKIPLLEMMNLAKKNKKQKNFRFHTAPVPAITPVHNHTIAVINPESQISNNVKYTRLFTLHKLNKAIIS